MENIRVPQIWLKVSHIFEFMVVQTLINIVIWHFDFRTTIIIIIEHVWVLHGSVSSLCDVAIQGSNHNILSLSTKRREYTSPLYPKSIEIVFLW